MWERITAWFKHSETIFLARFQIFVGALLSVIVTIEPNLFLGMIGSKWFPIFLIGHGLLVEYARKRRDDDMK
jgi:hypothetical protein